MNRRDVNTRVTRGCRFADGFPLDLLRRFAETLQVLTGVTICYPHMVPDGWKIFGTSSNQKPVLLAKEASSERQGRYWQHP